MASDRFTPQFLGSIPESYDRYLVPILFNPYADDLATRIEGGRVLEVACGTGAVSRVLQRKLGEDGKLIATDISLPMIDYARKASPEDIDFHQADAMALPYEANTFDAVVSQFGAMFFPDKPLGVTEFARVLKPGGKLVFSVWGTMRENPIFGSVEASLIELFPDEDDLLPTPSNMADHDMLRGLLQIPELADQKVSNLEIQAIGFTAEQVAKGYIYGTPVGDFLRSRGKDAEEMVELFTKVVGKRLGDPIDAKMVAYVCEATKI
jgi:SAM-dependent methyltransferase